MEIDQENHSSAERFYLVQIEGFVGYNQMFGSLVNVPDVGENPYGNTYQ